MITDAQIKADLDRVRRNGRQASRTEGEGKGSGRLKVIVRPMPGGPIAEFYAQQWRDGRRSMAKLGTYPAMSLKEARARFETHYADALAKGAPIKAADSVRPGTVQDLMDGYVEHLRTGGKRSWRNMQAHLNRAAALLGPEKLASEIAPADVVQILRPIYEDGKVSMAEHMRSYLRSAFGWGVRSERDYRTSRTSARRFNIRSNPAEGIPTEPKKVGTRWLDEEEFIEVFRALGAPAGTVTRHYPKVIQVAMLTGCRIEEVAQLRAEQWDSAERTLYWQRTKNGMPHFIPVCRQAAEILDSLAPSSGGFLFPAACDPDRPVAYTVLYNMTARLLRTSTVDKFTNRDMRRTFKTLAGKAGLTKTERDWLQNHRAADVSARHYDRYDGLPEKRAAVAKWELWLDDLFAGRVRKQQASVVRFPSVGVSAA